VLQVFGPTVHKQSSKNIFLGFWNWWPKW